MEEEKRQLKRQIDDIKKKLEQETDTNKIQDLEAELLEHEIMFQDVKDRLEKEREKVEEEALKKQEEFVYPEEEEGVEETYYGKEKEPSEEEGPREPSEEEQKLPKETEEGKTLKESDIKIRKIGIIGNYIKTYEKMLIRDIANLKNKLEKTKTEIVREVREKSLDKLLEEEKLYLKNKKDLYNAVETIIDIDNDIVEKRLSLIEKKTDKEKIREELKQLNEQKKKIIKKYPTLARIAIFEKKGFAFTKTKGPRRKAEVRLFPKEAKEAYLKGLKGERVQKFMKKHLRAQKEDFYKEIEDLDIDFKDLDMKLVVSDVSEIPKSALVTKVLPGGEKGKYEIKFSAQVPPHYKRGNKFFDITAGEAIDFLRGMDEINTKLSTIKRIDAIEKELSEIKDKKRKKLLKEEKESLEELGLDLEKWFEEKEKFLERYRKPIKRLEPRQLYFDPEIREKVGDLPIDFVTGNKMIKIVKSVVDRLSPAIPKKYFFESMSRGQEKFKKLLHGFKKDPLQILQDSIENQPGIETYIKVLLDEIYPVSSGPIEKKEMSEKVEKDFNKYLFSLPLHLIKPETATDQEFTEYVLSYLSAKYMNIQGSTLSDKLKNYKGKLSSIEKYLIGKKDPVVAIEEYIESKMSPKKKAVADLPTEKERSEFIEMIIKLRTGLTDTKKIDKIEKQLEKADEKTTKRLWKELKQAKILTNYELHEGYVNELEKGLRVDEFEDLDTFMDEIEKNQEKMGSGARSVENVQSSIFRNMQRFKLPATKKERHVEEMLQLLKEGKVSEIHIPNITFEKSGTRTFAVIGPITLLKKLEDICESAIEEKSKEEEKKELEERKKRLKRLEMWSETEKEKEKILVKRMKRGVYGKGTLLCPKGNKKSLMDRLDKMGEKYIDNTLVHKKYDVEFTAPEKEWLETITKKEMSEIDFVKQAIHQYVFSGSYSNYLMYKKLEEMNLDPFMPSFGLDDKSKLILAFIYDDPKRLALTLFPYEEEIVEVNKRRKKLLTKIIKDITVLKIDKTLLPVLHVPKVGTAQKTKLKEERPDIVSSIIRGLKKYKKVYEWLFKIVKVVVCLDPNNPIGEKCALIREKLLKGQITGEEVIDIPLAELIPGLKGKEVEYKELVDFFELKVYDMLNTYIQVIDPTVHIPMYRPLEYPLLNF